jgi:predicted nucleic acid-binding protein
MAIALAHGALRDSSVLSGDRGTGVLARKLTDRHILGILVEAKSQGLTAEVKPLLNGHWSLIGDKCLKSLSYKDHSCLEAKSLKCIPSKAFRLASPG